ncbi:MAG: hypothetical protein JO267_10595 [Alphaproteobacteria bacterium]|nr:hypothetical protein [Alphaproteobacteria bacterium]
MARGQEDRVNVADFPGLATAGGGGPYDPGVEARVAKLEANIEHIRSDLAEIKGDIREIRRDARSDFRLLFAAVIFVALGLAGLMAKGFHWIGG